MKSIIFTLVLISLSACAGANGGGGSSSGSTSIALGNIDGIELKSDNGQVYPYKITYGGSDHYLVRAFTDRDVYSDGSHFYSVAFGADGESLAINAYSLSGSQYGGFLIGAPGDLPASGQATFFGRYAGEIFATYGGIYVDGDVNFDSDFSDGTFSGTISNRSLFAQSGANNELFANDIYLDGTIEDSGFAIGSAFNDNAYGEVNAVIYGDAEGVVGTIVLTQINSIWGSTLLVTESGTFSAN